MSDLIEVGHSLTQPVPLPTLDDLLARVDTVWEEAQAKKDFMVGLRAINTMLAAGRLSGMGNAKMLWLMRTNWKKFKVDAEFEGTAFEVTGLSKTNVQRYTRVWNMYARELLPKQMRKKFMQRPMDHQIPVATMLAQGYQPTRAEWKKIHYASDGREIRKIIREIKGKPVKKGTVILKIERDGHLYAWLDDEKHYIGFLETAHATDDNPAVKKGINRIIDKAGIEKVE